MSVLRFTKKQLIEALEAKRETAKKYDEALLRSHEDEENMRVVEFQEKCRRYACMDLGEMIDKLRTSNTEERVRISAPSLPTRPLSVSAKLESHLRILKLVRQETFTISPGGQYRSLYWLLTLDDHPVCREEVLQTEEEDS